MEKRKKKQEIKELFYQTGGIPLFFIKDLKSRLPFGALKEINLRTDLPYYKIQSIFAGDYSIVNNESILIINSGVDILVELWGNNALNFLKLKYND